MLERGASRIRLETDTETGMTQIYGDALTETIYGLGYVQARDRLHQLKLNYASPNGLTCAIWGDGKHWQEYDKVILALTMRTDLPHWDYALSQEDKAVLQSFIDGFNAYLGTLDALPL